MFGPPQALHVCGIHTQQQATPIKIKLKMIRRLCDQHLHEGSPAGTLAHTGTTSSLRVHQLRGCLTDCSLCAEWTAALCVELPAGYLVLPPPLASTKLSLPFS